MSICLGSPVNTGIRELVDVSEAQQDSLLVDARLQRIYGLANPRNGQIPLI